MWEIERLEDASQAAHSVAFLFPHVPMHVLSYHSSLPLSNSLTYAITHNRAVLSCNAFMLWFCGHLPRSLDATYLEVTTVVAAAEPK